MPNLNVTIQGGTITSRDTVIIGDSAKKMTEYALSDFEITLKGNVFGCNGAGFLKGDKKNTGATVYADRLPDGRVLVSGEIIRAVLEIYTGKPMPADYLDYVYKVEAEEINGIKPRTISSGAVSFKTAGIKDDAAATFPQKITITLREGLI